MRLHAGLPPTFWAITVSIIIYLINRGPSIPLDCELSEEVWSGKEVKFSPLKTFVYLSYVLTDSNARSKLEVKLKKCYFISYGDQVFGYRFWDDHGQEIRISMNVIFNEKMMYKDKSNTTSAVAPQEPGL